MNNDQKRQCAVTFTVPFHDLDPMQMVWHGNYLKYFDITRTTLFAQAGVDLFGYFEKNRCLFPITKTTTKHIVSLRYRDEFSCAATVVEAQYKIVMDFQIRRIENNQLCTRGRSEQVAVTYPEMEMLFEIPEDIQQALGFSA